MRRRKEQARQVAEVFIVITKGALRRALLVVGLLAAAAIFYALAEVQDSPRESAGTLVFSDQFMPGIEPGRSGTAAVSGGGLEAATPSANVSSSAATPVTGEGPQQAASGRQDAPDAAGAGKLGDLDAVFTLAAGDPGAPASSGAPAFSAAADAGPLYGVQGGRSPAFDQYRLARVQNRSRQIEAIEKMLQGDRLGDAERRELTAQLLQLVAQREMEETAESLLMARGLTDVVVMIGRSGAEVVVVDVLGPEDAARIGDVVARVAGIPLNAITIVDGAPGR